MKKLISVIMTLTMLLSLGACAPKPKAPENDLGNASDKPITQELPLKGKLIGVLTPNATHGFTADSIAHAEAEIKALSEKEGFDYKFITANESSEQSNAVDTVLGMNPDCIVMWPINGDELRSAAQQIQDAGVPLIIYDRLIENFEPTSWMMGDNDAIGEGCGAYFNEFFKDELAKGKVNILEFKGDSSTVPMQRSNGFAKVADKNFNIVQAFDTGWQRQTSMEHMEGFLNTKSVEEIEAVQAIFTHDDEIVLGVMDAIKNYSGKAKINIKLISGVGGRKENVTLFKEPGIEGLSLMTYTFSPDMIRQAVKLGVEVLKGVNVEKSYLIDTEMVDATNVDAYVESEAYKIRYSL